MAGSGVMRLVLSHAQSAPAWAGDTEAGQTVKDLAGSEAKPLKGSKDTLTVEAEK